MMKTIAAIAVTAFAAASAGADPILPDWTAATFDSGSANLTNAYFPHVVGQLSIYEGEVDDGLERIEQRTLDRTKSILGVETRVVRDTEYVGGLLVEIAEDWYAQDASGNVWYFGETVINFEYDDDDNLIGTNDDGSWIADGVTNQPGILMFASPMVGQEYYQEFAPSVALDFAIVNALDAVVDIDYGLFNDCLDTSEGNLFDGPEIAEKKFYAPGVGLTLVQELDDFGAAEYEIELIEQRVVPTPATLALTPLAFVAACTRRRRVA